LGGLLLDAQSLGERMSAQAQLSCFDACEIDQPSWALGGEGHKFKEGQPAFIQVGAGSVQERQFINAMQQENERLVHENALLRLRSLQKGAALDMTSCFQPLTMDMPAIYSDSTDCGSSENSEPSIPLNTSWGSSASLYDDHGDFVESRKIPGAPVRLSVMMRNLPNVYSKAMLLELLDVEGFNGCVDFLYLPIDFHTGMGVGYAFLNFTSGRVAEAFYQHFTGYNQWISPSNKVCEVTWSATLHGLDAHIEKYRNSPVMHKSVPDEYKPALFRGMKQTPFPPPTKTIRAPRLRFTWH